MLTVDYLSLGSGVKELTGLKEAVNLKTLSLSGLTSDFMQINAAEITQVESLDLSFNQLTDITFLKELSNLAYVNLSYNQITDFTTAVELVKSKDLSFEYRDNPPEGLAQLFGLCTLKPATVMAGQTISVDGFLDEALSELTGAMSGGIKKETVITVVKREDPISEEEQLTKYVSQYVYRETEASLASGWTQEFLGLDVNGILWGYKKHKATDTEVEKYKIAENVTDQIVKDGFSFVLYIAEARVCYAAYIDSNPVKTIKVCDNAVSITENGDVWTTDGKSISPQLGTNQDESIQLELLEEPFEMVESIRYYEDTEGFTVYILALDTKGQLWKINAEERENGSGQWEFTGIDGVKQLTYDGYLKNDTLYSLDKNKFGKEILKNVKQIVGRYILDEKNDLYYVSSESESISVRFLMPSVDKITCYE